MERLYNTVHADLEKKRTEENKKLFCYEDVGQIVSEVYEDYEDAENDVIIEITQQIWDKYVEHLKNIEPDLEILDEDAVGLKGWFSDEDWDDWDDDREETDEFPTTETIEVERFIDKDRLYKISMTRVKIIQGELYHRN